MPGVLLVIHCLLCSTVMGMMCGNWMQYQPVVLAVVSAAGSFHAGCLSQVALMYSFHRSQSARDQHAGFSGYLHQTQGLVAAGVYYQQRD